MLELAPTSSGEERLHTSFPKCAFIDKTLVARNRLWWERLRYRYWRQAALRSVCDLELGGVL